MSEVNTPRTVTEAGPGEPDSVRESMQVLPRVFATPLTLLTGRPYAGQRPVRHTPTRHLVNALVSCGLGLAVSATALAAGGPLLVLLLPGWAATLHAARNLRMMIYHQCAHQNMWRKRKPDVLVGRLIAAALMIQDFDRYSAEHVGDHHALHHMTTRDPTVQAFLVTLKLRPGMSRGRMWRRVLGVCVSPGSTHASWSPGSARTTPTPRPPGGSAPPWRTRSSRRPSPCSDCGCRSSSPGFCR